MMKFLFTTKQEKNIYDYLCQNVAWICPDPDLFRHKECPFRCWLHQFWGEFEHTLENKLMALGERKAFRQRLL